MSENFNVFNSRDEIYLIFTLKELNFLFLLYFLLATCNVSPTEKGGAENAKTKKLANPDNFGTKIFVTF